MIDLANSSEDSNLIPVQSGAVRNALKPPSAKVTTAQQPKIQMVQPPAKPNKLALTNDNILEFSPFTFSAGINNSRILKGHSTLSKANLLSSLSCLFCNQIVV